MKLHLLIYGMSLLGFTVSLSDRQLQASSTICIPPLSIPSNQKLDFAACLDRIENFTVSQRNISGCFYDATQAVMTYSGCEILCGTGYGLWEWKDTVNRLSLLVLPTIVLIAHLAFPPLGWWNYFVVMYHTVGNPIGSLRSLLTRLENHRRLRRAGQRIFQGDFRAARSAATVFAAFEENSWQDASEHFTAMLTEKQLDQYERSIVMRTSHRLSSTRLASTSSAAVAIAALIGTLASAIVQTIKQIDEVNTRVYNETTGTIAVVCIMFMAIPQVWFSSRLGTFTTDSGSSHILETMSTRLREVSIVKDRTGPLFPQLQLAPCPLRPNERRPKLLLWIFRHLPSRLSSWFDSFFSHCPLEPHPYGDAAEGVTFLGAIPDRLTHLSLNSSWRPCKHLAPDAHGRSHAEMTITSIISVICGACLPAIFLSLTNHLDQRSLAVGCRALTWISITGIWISSFILDSIFRYLVCRFSWHRDSMRKVNSFWHWTVVKDAIVATVVTTLILLVELGRYNSCWCRASFSHPSTVTLTPYTAEQWSQAQVFWAALPSTGLFINLALILWVELSWKEWKLCLPWFSLGGGSPLCKTRKEMQGELDELKELERKDVTHVGRLEDSTFQPGKQGLGNFDAVEFREFEEIPDQRGGYGEPQGFWHAV
ncbi:hypothetical protein G7Y89_g2054 [Cudoniella acicularis]|uniref:Uncharacterized protein n=1 Tax=Cudoniella acicularis TaxID=354080 RepID=A0A8H4RV71_9HELO|nr:hypothetical protein G7Y89_g2054 [Cudoniella acicularis]